MWMWSGASVAHTASGARGPGFDSHPDPDGFTGSPISLLSDNRLKNDFINL